MKLLVKKHILNHLLKRDESSKSYWYMATVSVVLSVGATFINRMLFAHHSDTVPFLMYLGVILLSGCYGGRRCALFSLAAIIICGWFWLIMPEDSIFLSRYNWLEYTGFICECLFIVVIFYFIERILHKLHASEEKFRRIIELGAEGFFMCNEDGRVLYSSEASHKLLRYPPEHFSDKKLEDLVHPDEQKDFRFRTLKLQVKGSGSIIIQHRLKCHDSSWIWVECSINNLLKDPFVKSMVIHVRNVTTRVDQERQQEDFVHMASHELKSPVTAIKGFLQLLQRKLKKENNTEDIPLIERIEAQTEKLLNLTSDMLNITRIKAGELQYHFELIDVNACIREAVEALQPTTPSHHLELTIQQEKVIAWADKTRIGQVITNLISNAVKYSPDQQLVRISFKAESNQVKVMVADQGIGIPKAKQQRIFDRFYRVDTLPKGRFQGLGLGLFIASEIIRRHHGYMGVESEEGKGSTFWFTLPVREFSEVY